MDCVTILLRRLASMTPAEFVAYHRERHASLFRALAEVRQHVRHYVHLHACGFVLATETAFIG